MVDVADQHVPDQHVRDQQGAGEACCAPVTAEVLDEDGAAELAALLKVLADPARLRLLSLVAAADDGEACACDLVDPIGRSQPTVSHHLSQLVDAGLLEREKRGRWAWYRVVPARLEVVRDALRSAPPTDGFVHTQPQFAVRDLRAALGHYRDVLGFEITWVLDDEDGPYFANVGRGDLVLFLSEERRPSPSVLNAHASSQAFIDRLHGEYAEAGATVLEPPSERPWGLYEMRVEDLDGNVLRMQADLDEKPDAKGAETPATARG